MTRDFFFFLKKKKKNKDRGASSVKEKSSVHGRTIQHALIRL